MTTYTCAVACTNGLESKWWGPAWWTVLYSLAESRVSHTEYGIRTLASVLPCLPCRENFARHLQHYPKDNVLAWLKFAHEQASDHRQGVPVAVVESARASQQSVAFVARCIALNFPLDLSDTRCANSKAALSYLATVFREVTREEKRTATGNRVYENVFAYDPLQSAPCTRMELVAAVESALSSQCVVQNPMSLEALRYCSDLEERLSRYLAGYRVRTGLRLRSARTAS